MDPAAPPGGERRLLLPCCAPCPCVQCSAAQLSRLELCPCPGEGQQLPCRVCRVCRSSAATPAPVALLCSPSVTHLSPGACTEHSSALEASFASECTRPPAVLLEPPLSFCAFVIHGSISHPLHGGCFLHLDNWWIFFSLWTEVPWTQVIFETRCNSMCYAKPREDK